MYSKKSIESTISEKKLLNRDIAVVETLFSTGIRISELCNLMKKNIDKLLLFQLPISFEHKIQKIVLNQFDMHELFSRPTFFVLNNNTNIHLLVPVDSS